MKRVISAQRKLIAKARRKLGRCLTRHERVALERLADRVALNVAEMEDGDMVEFLHSMAEERPTIEFLGSLAVGASVEFSSPMWRPDVDRDSTQAAIIILLREFFERERDVFQRATGLRRVHVVTGFDDGEQYSVRTELTPAKRQVCLKL